MPVFLLAGLTGAFFRPLALSYTLAIVASMAVALTVTPALALLMLRGARIERRKFAAGRAGCRRATPRDCRRIIVRPVAAYLRSSRVTVLGRRGVPAAGPVDCSPPSRSVTSSSTGSRAPGTSAAEMERTTTQDQQGAARPSPACRAPARTSARPCSARRSPGSTSGRSGSAWRPNANYTATLDRIHAVANGYPGLFREVQTYLDERIEEVLTGGKEPIVVRVYGEDLKTLRAKSDQILRTW